MNIPPRVKPPSSPRPISPPGGTERRTGFARRFTSFERRVFLSCCIASASRTLRAEPPPGDFRGLTLGPPNPPPTRGAARCVTRRSTLHPPSTEHATAVWRLASPSLTLQGADFAAEFLAMRSSAPAPAPRRRARARRVVTRARSRHLRPYTLRKGDTLETIAQKRSMVDEIRKINSKLSSGAEAKVRDTILLPAGKLSARDKDIIDGITKINQPTITPRARARSIEDIIEPRGSRSRTSRSSSPGVNLGTFWREAQAAAGKYSSGRRRCCRGCGASSRASTCSSSSPKTRSTCSRAWRIETPSAPRACVRTEVRDQALGERSSRQSATIDGDEIGPGVDTAVYVAKMDTAVCGSPVAREDGHSCAVRGRGGVRNATRRGAGLGQTPPSVARVVND